MKLNVIVTRDIVANVYSNPMFVPHIGQAVRSFGDECGREDRNNPLWMHPEDFELWLIATYDDNDGTFDDANKRMQLAVGANYRRITT